MTNTLNQQQPAPFKLVIVAERNSASGVVTVKKRGSTMNFLRWPTRQREESFGTSTSASTALSSNNGIVIPSVSFDAQSVQSTQSSYLSNSSSDGADSVISSSSSSSTRSAISSMSQSSSGSSSSSSSATSSSSEQSMSSLDRYSQVQLRMPALKQHSSTDNTTPKQSNIQGRVRKARFWATDDLGKSNSVPHIPQQSSQTQAGGPTAHSQSQAKQAVQSRFSSQHQHGLNLDPELSPLRIGGGGGQRSNQHRVAPPSPSLLIAEYQASKQRKRSTKTTRCRQSPEYCENFRDAGNLVSPGELHKHSRGLRYQPNTELSPGGLRYQPNADLSPGGLRYQPNTELSPGGLRYQPNTELSPGGLRYNPTHQELPAGGLKYQPTSELSPGRLRHQPASDLRESRYKSQPPYPLARNANGYAQPQVHYGGQVRRSPYSSKPHVHVSKSDLESIKNCGGSIQYRPAPAAKGGSSDTPSPSPRGWHGVVHRDTDNVTCSHLCYKNNLGGMSHIPAVIAKSGAPWLPEAAAEVKEHLVQNCRGASHETHLHRAAQAGHLACVMSFLDLGASATAVDKYGMTAMKVAKNYGNDYIAQLLNVEMLKKQMH